MLIEKSCFLYFIPESRFQIPHPSCILLQIKVFLLQMKTSESFHLKNKEIDFTILKMKISTGLLTFCISFKSVIREKKRF